MQARPAASAEADAEVDAFLAIIVQRFGDSQLNVDLRMLSAEIAEAREEPS